MDVEAEDESWPETYYVLEEPRDAKQVKSLFHAVMVREGVMADTAVCGRKISEGLLDRDTAWDSIDWDVRHYPCRNFAYLKPPFQRAEWPVTLRDADGAFVVRMFPAVRQHGLHAICGPFEVRGWDLYLPLPIKYEHLVAQLRARLPARAVEAADKFRAIHPGHLA